MLPNVHEQHSPNSLSFMSTSLSSERNPTFKRNLSQSSCVLQRFENQKEDAFGGKKVRDVKWSIEALSVCHCQRATGEHRPQRWVALTQRGRGISSFSAL